MYNAFVQEKLCVDIRGNIMKYMQAEYNKASNSIIVGKYGDVLFSYKYLKNGILTESEETSEIIKNLLKKERISAKNVFINISDPSILLRIVKIPKMSEMDVKDYLNMEIPQYLPIDIQSSTFDFKVLGTIEEEGKKLLNVLLISLPKATVVNYCNLFKNAGLEPVVIDVYPNTISRAFGGEFAGNAMVVDLSQDILDFVTFEKGILFMYSSVEVKNSLIWGNKAIHDVKVLLEKDELFAKSMREIEGYIRTYMDFFSSRHFGKNVDTLYVLGELALMDNICAYLTQIFNIEVNQGLIGAFNVKTKKGININKRISMYPCNLGLMLRSV